VLKIPAFGNTQTVVPHCKKPTAQTAHLVFPDTQASPKNQKSCFFPTLDRIKFVNLRFDTV
jgi:hypothetical protein